MLGDVEVLRVGDEHALDLLEVGGARHGQGDLGRGDGAGATDRDVDRGRRDLGLALVLTGGAGYGHDVAEGDEVLVAAVEDEHPVGGGGVPVTGSSCV